MSSDVLGLAVPRSKTALMQHLQNLVLRGNAYWIGGVITPQKLAGLAQKMAARYPVLRTERGRAYDRKVHRATTHLVVYPTLDGIAWWVLSSTGEGGLADPSCADAVVARHAMRADGHIRYEDYVLLYAHKKDARTIRDARSGKEKTVIKDCSTWTWKMSERTMKEVLASVDAEVAALNYGRDDNVERSGLRGLLAAQRCRPLFSGVRAQVLSIHREAEAKWSQVLPRWRKKYTQLTARYGESAGKLRPVGEIASNYLPKMGRCRVFDGANRLLDLTCSPDTRADVQVGAR